jgi:hypothetical protein
MFLLDLCVTLDGEFETLRDTLQSLEHYAVLIRYPGLIVPVEMAEQHFQRQIKGEKILYDVKWDKDSGSRTGCLLFIKQGI